MRQDLRDALRALRRAPVFSLVAIALLALAIGSSTAVFSVVDAVLLRGLPYADADRLHTIYEINGATGYRVPSYPTFLDWQRQYAAAGNAIEGMAFIRGDGVSIPGTDGPERHIAAYVSPGFFALLGTKPVFGRTFLPDDERLGAPNVAVISHDFFMRRFGGDRAAVGRTITVDSVPTTIIGVMPRGYAYPNFAAGGWVPPALWQPIAVFQATGHQAISQRGLHVDSRTIVRLRSASDSAQAVAAMATIAKRLAAEYPVEQKDWTAVVLRPMSRELFGEVSSTLVLILEASGLVLLLACANVANLLLVRGSVRARELALRAALGADRWRLTRHLLTEAALLAAAAGTAGVAVAFGLVQLLRPYAEFRLPFASDISLDARTALFSIALSAATALLIGVLPVLHVSRSNLAARLRGGAGGSNDVGGLAARRIRDTLVAAQFALAITVVVGAGLLIQSVRRVSAVPLGYDEHGVVSFSISPSRAKYGAPEQAAALYKRIVEALRAVPTVEDAAIAGGALLETTVATDDHRGSTALPTAAYHTISADYLRTLRIRVAEGRGFTEDDMRAPNGFLVTQALAKKLWPQGSAIGQRITVRRASQARADFGQPITLPIVGVVADYRQFGPEQEAPAQVFLPYTLEVWPWMNFIVRAPNPDAILPQVTKAVRDVEPGIEFLGKPSSVEQRFAGALADPRVFVATLLSGFALTALLLAAIGLYGIIAYSVAQRTRELGICIAVGATSRSILTLILGHAAKLVGVGLVIGAGAALLTTKALRALLFETTTTDVTTFVVVPLVLAVVATIATLVPAMRATRTDPLVVIRAE
jgi:predicted permease